MEPGQYKDYYYLNALPRTLWYHDHANGASVQNMLNGMVASIKSQIQNVINLLAFPSENTTSRLFNFSFLHSKWRHQELV